MSLNERTSKIFLSLRLMGLSSMKGSSGRSLGQPVSMPGHQDASEQSHREGGAESGDWGGMAIGKETAGVRGLLDAEHVVYRTADAYHPARLSVSLPADDMSRPLEGASGRPPGVASMLLQFRQNPPGAEIRTRSPDAGHTGRIDQKAADVTGDLHFGDGL